MHAIFRSAFICAIFLFCCFSSGYAQGCRQVCDNAYPNNIGFDCPTGLGGTWEPLDSLYTCENNSTLGCAKLDVTNIDTGLNSSIWSIQCDCADGWTGQTCGMCTTSDACTQNNTLIECNRTPAPYKRKTLECYPQQDIVKQLFGEGTISYTYDVEAAQSYIYLWKRTAGQPYKVNCTMYDCKVSDDGNNNVVFECNSIACSCNPDPLLVNCTETITKFILDNLRGYSKFSCENKENPTCTLDQVDIPVQVSLSCSASECGKPTGLVVTESDKVTGIVLGALVLPIGIAVLLMLPFIIYVADMRRVRPENTAISAATKGSTLELINVEYKVTIRSGNSCKKDVQKKTVLRNVNMKILPGQVCAVMGSSGAGKTTLLDIMSDVGKRGDVSGDVLLDGRPLPKHFKRITGYVTQEECLLGTLTVTEQLIYSAQLRLPSSVPYSQIQQIVSNVIADLRLNHVANTLIGDTSVRGLSGGERRRVSIATELVTYPRILLLDEPTSGLDSYNATVVMQLLQDLAKKRNCSIICSIHQPRRMIYQMFDVLVLLWNGNIVYHGPAQEAMNFFADQGYKCPEYENPADYMLSVVNEESEEQLQKLTGAYEEHRAHPVEKLMSSINVDDQDGENNKNDDDKEVLVNMDKMPKRNDEPQEKDSSKKEAKYSSSWDKQFLVLAHRSAVKMWRNPALLRTHLIITVVVAVFIGVIFLNLANDVAGFQNRLGMIFFSLILFGFGCLSAIDLFIGDRVMFQKERANGCYYTSSYYISTMLSDLLPLRIIFPLIYGVVVYWMAGFVGDPEHFLKFIFVFLLFNMVVASMFYVISIGVPSVTVGSVVSAAILLFLMLFSGLLVNNDSIPIWLIWLRYLSFFSYAFESISANELTGLNLSLSVEGYGSVDISANVFLVAFSLNADNYWRNVGILAGMFVALNILAYILLRFVRKPKQ